MRGRGRGRGSTKDREMVDMCACGILFFSLVGLLVSLLSV